MENIKKLVNKIKKFTQDNGFSFEQRILMNHENNTPSKIQIEIGGNYDYIEDEVNVFVNNPIFNNKLIIDKDFTIAPDATGNDFHLTLLLPFS